jgi:acid phosphatase (class A)
MQLHRRLLLAAALAALCVPAVGAEIVPYLTAKQLDLLQILPPPPAAGSATDQADVAAVIAAQKDADAARIALAQHDVDESVFVMFTATLGDKFVTGNLPIATLFFDRVGQSEDDTVDPAKTQYGRVRPYLAHADDIKPLVKATKSQSYPSGHTTRVTMMAILLGDMLPEKKAEIWARAREYAHSRVVGGMHYPTDIDAGVIAGTAMATTMLADPAFRADFAAAKAEVRKVMGY